MGLSCDPSELDPHLVATAQRAQSDALATGTMAALAVIAMKDASHPAIGMALGLIFVLLSFARADRIAEALACLDRDDPLPVDRLLQRSGWALNLIDRDR